MRIRAAIATALLAACGPAIVRAQSTRFETEGDYYRLQPGGKKIQLSLGERAFAVRVRDPETPRSQLRRDVHRRAVGWRQSEGRGAWDFFSAVPNASAPPGQPRASLPIDVAFTRVVDELSATIGSPRSSRERVVGGTLCLRGLPSSSRADAKAEKLGGASLPTKAR